MLNIGNFVDVGHSDNYTPLTSNDNNIHRRLGLLPLDFVDNMRHDNNFLYFT